jgi:hypothetical protein
MMRRRRMAALGRMMLLAIALFAGAARVARAQSIQIILPTVDDSISPAPSINVVASLVPPDQQPASITFEVSFEEQFRTPFFARSAPGAVGRFQLDSLLPQRTVVHMRARLLDRSGVVRAEQVIHPVVHSWLTLVSPVRSLEVLFTRHPTFSYRTPAITLPPGPWIYTVTITNVGQNRIEQQIPNLSTTDFVPTVPLDACTSYRWSVTARAPNGGANDEITVKSPGTFVIQSAECPSATLFLQPFPNPFGAGTPSDKVCFWFDLAHRSTVSLTIYDLRLRQVKRIVPGAIGVVLDSGAFGRQSLDAQTGCDQRLTWDGRDERGRPVPPGIYMVVFEADGVRISHKILYKGP